LTRKNQGIPIIAVAGDKGTGTTARILDMILRGTGRSVGLALRARSFVNGRSVDFTDEQQISAAQALLCSPVVDTVVSTVSPRLAARRGLNLESIRVTVIMDKVKDIKTELFHAGLDVVQRATTDCFVVQAGNIVALDRLQALKARQLILVSDRLNDPGLQAHLNSGHKAVATLWGQQDGEARMVLVSGNQVIVSVQTNIGSSRDGRTKKRRFKYAMLFAVAAAFGLGLSGSEITAALRNAPAMVTGVD
jgi:hypothetical protein